MLQEILNQLLAVTPGWALLALELLERLRRRRKYKRSDGKREDV